MERLQLGSRASMLHFLKYAPNKPRYHGVALLLNERPDLDVLPKLEEAIGLLFKETPPCIVMTLHQAKGLDRDNAWILGMDQIPAPQSFTRGLLLLHAEFKLLFVGLTRAKHDMFLTTTTHNDNAGSSSQQSEGGEPALHLTDVEHSLFPEDEVHTEVKRTKVRAAVEHTEHKATVARCLFEDSSTLGFEALQTLGLTHLPEDMASLKATTTALLASEAVERHHDIRSAQLSLRQIMCSQNEAEQLALEGSVQQESVPSSVQL